jgi:hypothetical protein
MHKTNLNFSYGTLLASKTVGKLVIDVRLNGKMKSEQIRVLLCFSIVSCFCGRA